MNKNWLITGASSGIGLEMVQSILAKGDHVFATLRKLDALQRLKDQYPEQLTISHLELTDNDEIIEVIAKAFGHFGGVDVVVSNAGYGVFGAVEELSDNEITRQLDVNLLGSIRLVKAVVPYLRKQQSGHIIQVSSEGGQNTYPGFGLYHASKWGVEGFIESMAKDLADFNIKFTIAQPGPTGTNFAASLVMADALEVYAQSPVNDVRKYISDGFGELDDVADVANAIIEAAYSDAPPLRLAIGRVASENVRNALKERLAVLATTH